ASQQWPDTEQELGLNGKICIYNKEIYIEEDDTLTTIAAKINQADAGASATIIDGRLVITAAELNKCLELKDVGDGDILRALGILKGELEGLGADSDENSKFAYEFAYELQKPKP